MQQVVYFMGSRIRPEIGDFNVFCETCMSRFYRDRGLNQLDHKYVIEHCHNCNGTNRCPIPLAEVMNIRKIGNEQ